MGAVREHEERDFTDYVAARRLALRRLAFVVLRDWAAADDAVQDALVRLFRVWSRPAPHERLDAYVRRLVINEALRSHRKRRRFAQDPGTFDDAPEAPLVQLELRDALWKALGHLTAQQRAAIALRYLDELSEGEAAAAMNCPVGTVKSHTSRGLAALRRFAATYELHEG